MITDDVKSMLTLEISDAIDRADRKDKLDASERMAIALRILQLFHEKNMSALIAFYAGVHCDDRVVLRLLKEVEGS